MKQGKEEKGNNKLVKWFLAFHKQRGNGEEKWEKKHQKTNYKSQRYLKVNQWKEKDAWKKWLEPVLRSLGNNKSIGPSSSATVPVRSFQYLK